MNLILAGLIATAAAILVALLVWRPTATRKLDAVARRAGTGPGTERPPASANAQVVVPAALTGLRMIEEGDLSPARAAQLRAALRTIAKPPKSLGDVLSPAFVEESNATQLADFITREPMIATKVLATVNSPLYGLRSPIVSVGQAVTFLGRNTIRNVAVQMLAQDSFKAADPALQRLYDAIWHAGTIGSELCFRLAQKLGVTDPGALSTQTLLSFFGDFATLTLLPSASALGNWQLRLLARTEAEQREIGVAARVVGDLTMREWGMPAAIVQAVQDVNRVLIVPPEALSPDRAMRAAICYASARIGEEASFRGLRDLTQFDFRTDDAPDYFHLNRYLARRELSRFHQYLHAPEIRAAIGEIIGTVPEAAAA